MAQPSGNVRDTGDFDFKSFLLDIPPVTRTLFITMATCTVLSLLGIIPIHVFVLEWESVLRNFQIWRVIFTFCHAGAGGFGFLIRMYFLYVYSKQLENGTFFGRTANYAWFLTIVAVTVLASSALFFTPLNGGALFMAIIHLWGRHAGNMNVTLYGFIKIPAKYLSLVMILLDVVINGSFVTADVLGLLGGHLYYFLDSVYPGMRNGKQLISVPLWYAAFVDRAIDFLGSTTGLQRGPPVTPPGGSTTASTTRFGTSGAVGSSSRSRTTTGSTDFRSGPSNPSAQVRHRWGAGNALGSQ